MNTWQVGKFTITEVQEFPIAVGLLDGFIPDATASAMQSIDWMYPRYANEAGQILADVHSYVIDTGSQVILVDAGTGNGKSYPMMPSWTGLDTPFLATLEAAGYSRDDIDIVLCTHLHLDHIGWFSMQDDDGLWVPTFPNARLILIEAEYERHLNQIITSMPEKDPEPEADVDPIARAFAPDALILSEQTKLIQDETIQPVVDAGRLEFVRSNEEIVEGVRYAPTPGHTSAHHSVRLQSGGSSAFITGDFFHHPVQIAHPEWTSMGDWNSEVQESNRRTFLTTAAGTDLLVLGTHFSTPSGGHIVEHEGGFRFIAAS